MRILAGAAVVLAAVIGPAGAQSPVATIQAFGLVGTWSTDCAHDGDVTMVVAVPDKGPPTRTVVTSGGAHATTTTADILGAETLGTTGLVIQAAITGGDRDGGPLPGSMMTGLDQSFEKTAPNVLYIKGRDPVRLERCPTP